MTSNSVCAGISLLQFALPELHQSAYLYLNRWSLRAGISGLQFVLPATWTALQHRRRAAKEKKQEKKRDKFEQTFELDAKLRRGLTLLEYKALSY